MVRKSSRLAARPRKFYGEDYLWDKEVRRAEAERDGPKGGATRIGEKIGEDWNQHLEEPQVSLVLLCELPAAAADGAAR